jgi:hypothetical protein
MEKEVINSDRKGREVVEPEVDFEKWIEFWTGTMEKRPLEAEQCRKG